MIGKLSIEFSSSMVGKPQNRTEIVTPFFENLGGKLIQMLYINHPEMNAIAFIEAPNDETVASIAGIVKASGMFDDLNWYRAFDAGELQKISYPWLFFYCFNSIIDVNSRPCRGCLSWFKKKFLILYFSTFVFYVFNLVRLCQCFCCVTSDPKL